MTTAEDETAKHQRTINAVCTWMGWTIVDRRGGRCWQHFVADTGDKQHAEYEPVSSFDPWKFREDLYWVLRAVTEKQLARKLGESWIDDGLPPTISCLPTAEMLVLFSLEHPRDLMKLVLKLTNIKEK